MSRVIKVVGIAAGILIFLALFLYWFIDFRWRQDLLSQGNGDFLNVDAKTLESELRDSLPLGSSQSFVEEVLKGHHLRFSFNGASQTLYAGARDLKGSNWLIETGLSLQFHFDKFSALRSIDSRVVYTGP